VDTVHECDRQTDRITITKTVQRRASHGNDNAVTRTRRTHPITQYFSQICFFFTLNVRKWMIKCEYAHQQNSNSNVVAIRGKSKSSHKEIQRQAKIAFFISNECRNRVSITRIWNQVIKVEFWNRVRVPGSCYKSLVATKWHSHHQMARPFWSYW